MRDVVFCLVRIGGLEPPLREELDPKSSAATNYAISALCFPCVCQMFNCGRPLRKRLQNYNF